MCKQLQRIVAGVLAGKRVSPIDRLVFGHVRCFLAFDPAAQPALFLAREIERALAFAEQAVRLALQCLL